MNLHWHAVGWTLVHFLWQGAIIALVYRVLDLALARHSANARYVLALAAMLVMLAVSLATLAYEEASLHPGAVFSDAAFSGESAGRGVWTSVSLAPVRVGGSAESEHRVTQFLPGRSLVDPVLPFLDALWFAGVLVLTLRALGGWWLLRRLRLSPLHPAPHTLLLRLDAMRLQMGVRHFVELRLSSRIANPLTAGVLRPWILLPIAALTRLSPEQIEVVLSHELAHIRRRDYLWNILQTVVETVFFFHPAVWWISRRAREERELCCDDAALARCPDPSVYASALLRLEEERRNHLRLAMALDGHASRAGLRARILRILGDPDPSPRSVRPLSLAGIAVAVAIFFCPMPRLFASFRAVPKAATSISHAVTTATHAAFHAAPAAGAQATAPPASTPAAAEPAEPSAVQTGAAPASDSNPESTRTADHSDYIDQMRAAGYDVDLDKYVAMKVQGITPEYAASMSKVFGEKLSADRLIALKVQDVSPAYVSKMRAAGYDADASKFIAMKVQGVSPEYADAMSKLGFGKPTVNQLIALRVQGVSPDDAARLHAGGVEAASFNDLIEYHIFNVSPEFVDGMKAAGFPDIPAKKLVNLRVQNVTPEFAKSVKAQFPDATVEDLVRMRIFNINADFIASAKQHGFEPLTIQKLVKLRISGILDDAGQKN